MTWLSSFVVALLTGLFGLVCVVIVFGCYQSWYRISDREGAASYLMLFHAIWGGMAAIAIGLIAARMVAAGTSPGFLKGLGTACGAVFLVSLVITVGLWACSEPAPKLGDDGVGKDGRPLALAIEMRCPKNFILPVSPDETGATAGLDLERGGRQPTVKLRLDESTLEDGHRMISAVVPLVTNYSAIALAVRFTKKQTVRFALPLRSSSQEGATEWSTWIESDWKVGTPEPAAETKFAVRYRVQ